MNRLLKIGGENFDTSIADLVRHNREFMIGILTAEKLRREFGVFDQSTDSAITVSGRDLVTGVPAQTDISISLVRAAMKELLEECVRAIRSMIERTPPDVRRDDRKERNLPYRRNGKSEGTLYISHGEYRSSCPHGT